MPRARTTLFSWAAEVLSCSLALRSGSGLSLEDLNNPAWVKDPAKADAIAAAVLEWAKSIGASNFCHWFQVGPAAP